MRIWLAILLPVLAAFAAGRPAPAAASGAWTTFIRAYTYYDLLAEGDTVWCATGEAGLLRYQRRDSSFVAINREPGGLAGNHLSTLLRDRSGRLWVGTLGAGASRLTADGKKWNLVNRFDGLPSDSVTAFAARGDTLLIGTTRGIALWNGIGIIGALPDGVNPSPFTNGSDWITGIVIHGDSAWVSTQAGVYRSRFSQGLTTWTLEIDFLPTTAFQGIVADDTTLIALQGNTPFRHAFNTGGPWAFARNLAGGGFIPPAVRIYEDHGKILLTTDLGFYVWDPPNGGWRRVTNQFVSDRNDDERSFALTVDAGGRYFAADRDGLRERVGDPDLWAQRLPPGPPGNNILNVAVDGGRVWVNTFTEGIGRLDGQGWRIWPFAPPCTVGCDSTFYAPDYAFALLVDRRDKKWFGCWGQAVEMFDDSLVTPAVTHHRYTDILHTCAWASAADSLGGRWFGMDTYNFDFAPLGLDYYGLTGALEAHFGPDSFPLRGARIHGLTVDRAGRLWVGYTGQGIDIIDLNQRPPARPDSLPKPLTVPGSERYDVQGLVAHEGRVWALTTGELIAYNSTTATRIVSYAIPGPPGQLSVNPLAVAPDGTVWVGTLNGVRVVDPSGGIQDFDTGNSPLADDEVRAIRVDDATGVVWIGTTHGLHRYDPGYLPPTPALLSLVSARAVPDQVDLTWFSAAGDVSSASVYRRTVRADWEAMDQIWADGTGRLVYHDAQVIAGTRYGYRLGVMEAGQEVFVGEAWLDVPVAAELALAGFRSNPARDLTVSFSLPDASPARLELFDVVGRRITGREVGTLGAGNHVVTIGDGRTLAPGIYLLRLVQGRRSVTSRAAILR